MVATETVKNETQLQEHTWVTDKEEKYLDDGFFHEYKLAFLSLGTRLEYKLPSQFVSLSKEGY